MKRWLIQPLKTLYLLSKFIGTEGRNMPMFSAPLIFPFHPASISGKSETFKLLLKGWGCVRGRCVLPVCRFWCSWDNWG